MQYHAQNSCHENMALFSLELKFSVKLSSCFAGNTESLENPTALGKPFFYKGVVVVSCALNCKVNY